METEPQQEKTWFFAYAKTKAQNSCAITVQLINPFVFATVDSTFPLLHKSEISRLLLSPMVAEPSLCQTCSESPKTGFLMRRLKLTEDNFFSKRGSFVIDTNQQYLRFFPTTKVIYSISSAKDFQCQIA